MTARIGILGGTFDPIHYGHLAIAEDARVALELDHVIFIPAAQPPFKLDRRVALAANRLAMVERACVDNAAFRPSTIEIDREGISYTVTTLEALHANRHGRLFFIIGADALAELPAWHRAARLPELAHIVAVQRPGYAVDPAPVVAALPGLADQLTMLDGPRLDISSTEIRRRIAAERSVRYLMPDSVIAYIDQHNLYR